MTPNSIEQLAVCAIAATCQVEESSLTSEISLDDLGLGSMGLVAVISRVEAALELELTPDEVIGLLQAITVKEFVDTLQPLLCQKGRGLALEGTPTSGGGVHP